MWENVFLYKFKKYNIAILTVIGVYKHNIRYLN